MKIAILSWTFYPALGGTQVFLYRFIEELVRKGHEVDIYLPSYCYKESKKFEPKGSRIFKLFIFENYILKYCSHILKKKIANIQNKNLYDVWQVIGAYPSAYLCNHLKEICPIVLRTHGEDIQVNEKLNYGFGLNKKIQKKIDEGLNNANKLIAITNDVKDIYLSKKIDPKKIEVIPNGVEIEDIQRKKLDNKNYKFLTVGRSHPKKGYDIIPQVIKKLKKKNIKFMWTVVGQGVSELDYLKDNEISDRIKIIDKIEPEKKSESLNFPPLKLRHEYFKNDFFIMTSHLETFGMVLIEAISYKLLVISSNSKGCRDVIKDGHNGILFKAGNAEDLTNKIIYLLDDYNLREKIFNNSQKDIKNYEWNRVSENYIKLYDELLN